MTSQEARQLLDMYESQITDSYSDLCNSAKKVGEKAVLEASEATSKARVWFGLPLIGVVLFFASHPVWGVLLMIIGGLLASSLYSDAKAQQIKIENRQRILISRINDRLKI